MNSRFVLPASIFSCCVCVVNFRRRVLLLVLLCNRSTLHVKKVTELLHKQQHTRREMGEAEENRRILLSRTYGLDYMLVPLKSLYTFFGTHFFLRQSVNYDWAFVENALFYTDP